MYSNWYTTTLSLIAVTYSRVFHPCRTVQRFPLPRFRPLLRGATFSTPAFSTPVIWCHVFHSRVFSAPTSRSSSGINLVNHFFSFILTGLRRSYELLHTCQYMNPEIVSFQYATGICLLLENVGGCVHAGRAEVVTLNICCN